MTESALPDDPDPPEDAELIAYLDGELDLAEARAVEARLARDSSARNKAEAYKKTFDLLDFLPRTEPSADFATKTLTKLLPVIDADSPPSPSSSDVTQVHLPSTPSQSAVAFPPQPAGNPWLGGVAWLLAGVLAVAGGFVVRAFVGPGESTATPTQTEPIADADKSVIDSLPLYVGVDDLDFAKRLDSPDLFRPEPGAERFPRTPISPRDRDKLVTTFLSYPSARKQQLRTLDAGIRALPAAERNQLIPVLEDYSSWLDRLPDGDRREVLSAAGPGARIEVVMRTKEKLWRESLPTVFRDQLRATADTTERLSLVGQWRQTELARRDEWALARRQWSRNVEPFPWPFAEQGVPRQVDEYLRTALRFNVKEMNAACRLGREEVTELRTRAEAAAREGSWLLYGASLYRAEQKHPALPEFGGKPSIVNFAALPKELVAEIQRKSRVEIRRLPSVGKWPDFALDVADAAALAKVSVPDLGPAKPGEFTDSFNQFLAKSLTPALSDSEHNDLRKLEGKWPEYPRKAMELARKKDLPVPGLTLPGKPSLWAAYYGFVDGK